MQAFAGAASLELARRPGEVGETPGGQWLRVWRAEAPKDAGGAAVQAEFLVQQAWRTATPGTDEFRIIMEEAKAACGEAALLAPGDPIPYIVELSVARGLGYTREEFEQLWLKILDRAPDHMGAHLAALHYWCEKWHGSRELAYSFAEAAAARAPRAPCSRRCPSSRSSSTCPRSPWSAASTRARSSPRRSTAPCTRSTRPARTTRCRRTSAICWCSSWSAVSAGPRR